jgi:hypothetical protein
VNKGIERRRNRDTTAATKAAAKAAARRRAERAIAELERLGYEVTAIPPKDEAQPSSTATE